MAAPPSPHVTKLFRIHLNFLNGAILALLFPVINTRLVSYNFIISLYKVFYTHVYIFQLTFETETYYVQHIAMLVVPYYLLRLGGNFVFLNLIVLCPLLKFFGCVNYCGFFFFLTWVAHLLVTNFFFLVISLLL